MRFLQNRHTDPYYNMAFDEYCLEHRITEEPIFYLWQNKPAVIIGANQQIATEVNVDYLNKNNIVLARRVTGGGAVYHDLGNLNYTIVGNTNNIESNYPEYIYIMQQALLQMGVPAVLSGRNDIMVNERKVSGFAKRVAKERLMVHGTLMYDVNIDVLSQALTPPSIKLETKGIASVRSRVCNLKEYLPQIPDIASLKNELQRILSNNYTDKEIKISTEMSREISLLASKKFAHRDWIYGHSPQATLKQSARLSCGNVTIHLTINKGVIQYCKFEGDFLGYFPISQLEDALLGIHYERSAINEQLSKLPISSYLDGVKTNDLLKIII